MEQEYCKIQGIQFEAINYFHNLFENKKGDDIIYQLEIVKIYPSMFQEEEANIIDSHVTIQEIKEILSQFSRDKIPTPNGWTTDLFMGFFDLVGEYFLKVVKETRLSSYIPKELNAIFLNLCIQIILRNSGLYPFAM